MAPLSAFQVTQLWSLPSANFYSTFTLHLETKHSPLPTRLTPTKLTDMKNTEISPEEKHGAILMQVAPLIQQIKKCQTSWLYYSFIAVQL